MLSSIRRRIQDIKPKVKTVLKIIGFFFVEWFQGIGRVSEFVYRVLVISFSPPYDVFLVFQQMVDIGVRSISIVVASAFAIGMVMVVQLSWGFSWFGAEGIVGPVVTLALVRELGPVVTSLLVGGRVGSGITAEIGSMNVTEQIDALRALGADPFKKLVAPRLLASLFSFPLLAIIADLSGIIGAMLMSKIDLAVGPKLFLTTMKEWVDVSDLVSGISKTILFGAIVSITGCYMGMNASGGTQGVGKATTHTVVVSLLLIIISDFVLSKIFVYILYL